MMFQARGKPLPLIPGVLATFILQTCEIGIQCFHNMSNGLARISCGSKRQPGKGHPCHDRFIGLALLGIARKVTAKIEQPLLQRRLLMES
jgi:hypothetical protein